jgi:hypothetical protein
LEKQNETTVSHNSNSKIAKKQTPPLQHGLVMVGILIHNPYSLSWWVHSIPYTLTPSTPSFSILSNIHFIFSNNTHFLLNTTLRTSTFISLYSFSQPRFSTLLTDILSFHSFHASLFTFPFSTFHIVRACVILILPYYY